MKTNHYLSPRKLLEIERKFAPTSTSITLLRHNTGKPSFTSHLPLRQRHFEDIYYDYHDTLFNRGIWLRQRGQNWQAKVRKGGDFTNSVFQELTGVYEINSLLSNHVKGVDLASGNFGDLMKVANFATDRESWLINEKFTVVIDQTNFGHVVGEVELTCAYDDIHGVKSEMSVSIDSDKLIEEFMRLYQWAFPHGKVLGKLSAYHAWKEKQGRQS